MAVVLSGTGHSGRGGCGGDDGDGGDHSVCRSGGSAAAAAVAAVSAAGPCGGSRMAVACGSDGVCSSARNSAWWWSGLSRWCLLE